VVNGARRLLLRAWGHVPRAVRRWIVRVAAPSFTVGAACVIERDDGSILLVRLSYRRGWGLPGGLIQRREDVATCARREVSEEVGLDVELVGAPAVVVDSRPQRIDVVYRARPGAGADPDQARPTSAEIVEARWFPAGDLPTLQHEAVAALGALAASAFGVDAVRGDGATAGRGAAPAGGDQRTIVLTEGDGGQHGPGGPGDPGDRGGAGGDAATSGDHDEGHVLRLAAAQAALQRDDTGTD
jgi:8-oxo-dGTP diphosphatase